jgi:hypothetical protein
MDREDKQDADHHLLEVGLDLREIHPVLDETDEDGAEHDIADAPDPAAQELFEEHRLVRPQPEHEDADKALVRQLPACIGRSAPSASGCCGWQIARSLGPGLIRTRPCRGSRGVSVLPLPKARRPPHQQRNFLNAALYADVGRRLKGQGPKSKHLRTEPACERRV